MFHSGSWSWKSEIRVPAVRILVRAVFQACLQTTSFSSCVVTWLFLDDCWETEEKEGGRAAGRDESGKGGERSFSAFMLEHNWLTLLCRFCCTLRWISCVYTCTPPSRGSFPPHSLTLPFRSSQSTRLSSLPAGCLSYARWFIRCQSQSPSLSYSFLPCPVHVFVLYICVSVPALELGSSVPFF